MSDGRIFTREFILLALVNLFVFASWQMILTGLPLYLDLLGADPAYIGLTTTLATGAAVLVRPISGMAVDRYGRKIILVMGFIVMVAAMVGYAFVPLASAILILRFIHGIGWGFGSTANSTLAADIIPKKRFAESMGYFAMTNSLAMALAPACSIWLMGAGHSRVMMLASAGLGVASLALAMWLFATGYRQPSLKRGVPLTQALAPANMFERSALFPSVVMFFPSLGFGALSTFIALLGDARGIEGMALYFVVYALANVVSRPVIGRWADRSGFFFPGIMACLAVAASLAIVAWASSLAMVIVAGIFVGVGMGTAMSVFQTMSVAVVKPTSRGAAMSTYLFLFNAGIALGALLAGVLAEAIGYAGMFLALAALSLVGCAVFMRGGRVRIDSYHTMQQQ